jgi:ribosomal protein S18 acetylase RimI-like enzyme
VTPEQAPAVGQVSIRPAGERDLPACMEMFAELNRLQARWRVFPPRTGLAGEMEHKYHAALADPDALLLVAEEEGETVGMAAGHVHQPSTFSTELAVELSSVYVRPSHRRQGVARRLTAEVARFARSRGVDRITLKTFSQNEEAVEAWARMGFEPRALQMTATTDQLEGPQPVG